ncbi:hypothetical protein SAMD00019534_120340 [Acytostelium subglobosum LB1]|uniref:hypothetical protein n=1 Tax=Acytostelium subglobosum LB1 TaxID=1410327 RepID=UPI0006449C42|nr:hypothetical protein SAMD00019534_120340 [Acytostelium subglobosum LB1]GAM28858.1 hypothetical protein SAMD00019534_120340 [Acytostelium subglobosum LB1]|eukprot:XP_012748230.1 hypothetical protein SAMD00019534_120340 [Acytostelium subglobosum LB1]
MIPHSVTRLHIDANCHISVGSIPEQVTDLKVYELESLNICLLSYSPLAHGCLPSSLCSLTLRVPNCVEPIPPGALPPSLTYLDLVCRTKLLSLPRSLQTLILTKYNHDLDDEHFLPQSLTRLSLDTLFKGNIPPSSRLPLLRRLDVPSWDGNCPTKGKRRTTKIQVDLPPKLTTLSIRGIPRGATNTIPYGVTTLTLNTVRGLLPDSLTRLSVHEPKLVDPGAMPPLLKTIKKASIDFIT